MKTNNVKISATLLLCLLACVSVTVIAEEMPEAVSAKFGTARPPDHPTVRAMLSFQKRIERLLPERFTIQIFPDEQLGEACELLEGIQFGHIEMGVVSLELLADQSPLLATISTPYIFRDDAHRLQVLDGPIGQRLLRSLEDANLIGLGFLDTGYKNILTTGSALQTPKDFQGQQIGVRESCQNTDNAKNIILRLSLQHFQALGAEGVAVSNKEQRPAFPSDSLTGLEIMSLSSGLRDKIPAENLVITLTEHITVPDVIIASKRWFDTLPADAQHVLVRAASAMVKRQRSLRDAIIQQTRNRLQEEGIELIPIKDKDKAAFRKAVQPVYQQMKETLGSEFDQLLKAINAVR